MNTSDMALLVSLFSLCVAMAALLWNIYQKFIFVKPDVQVTFNHSVISIPGSGIPPKDICALHGLNLGPGPVILEGCWIRAKKHWWKRYDHGMLNPIANDPMSDKPVAKGPFGGGLPAKILEGESRALYFPFTNEGFPV